MCETRVWKHIHCPHHAYSETEYCPPTPNSRVNPQKQRARQTHCLNHRITKILLNSTCEKCKANLAVARFVLLGAERALEKVEHERREKYYSWAEENPDLANLEIPKKVVKAVEKIGKGSGTGGRTKKEKSGKDRRGNSSSSKSRSKERTKEKKKSASTRKKIVRWVAGKIAEEMVEVSAKKLQEMEDRNGHDGQR